MSLPDGYRIFHYTTLGSTSDVIKQLAAEGAGAGSVVIADQQTKGRGRRGNVWGSPEGNLYLSLLLREDVPVRDAGQLSFLAAVALADAIEPLLAPGNDLEQKWPNDLWLNGAKLAGILLESEGLAAGGLDWLIIGMGVNIALAPENAVALQDFMRADISPRQLAERWIKHLDIRLKQWRQEGFLPIRRAWMAKARGLDSEIIVRLPQEERRGVFKGIDAAGYLLLETDDGQQKIASGDVFFK